MSEPMLPSALSRSALDHLPYAVVITNPQLDDNPIVYVNGAFERLSGYAEHSVVGRNCRFLQGEDSDAAAVERLREAIRNEMPITVDLVNYRAHGERFMNRLYVTPMHGPNGELSGFLGLQREVDQFGREASVVEVDDKLREIEHRVKNHLSMIISLIRTQQRNVATGAMEHYGALARRVETLQLLYQEMSENGTAQSGNQTMPLGAYVTRIASAISHLEGRAGVRVNIDVDQVGVSVDAATQTGLLLSEVLTNAYQHAFNDRSEGLVEVRLNRTLPGTIRLQVRDDGAGLPEGASWPGEGTQGSRIVRALLNGLGAELDVASSAKGTTVTIDMPDRVAVDPLA